MTKEYICIPDHNNSDIQRWHLLIPFAHGVANYRIVRVLVWHEPRVQTRLASRM